MKDYDWNGSPWYSSRNSIRTIQIEPGVTSIGVYAFSGCSSLTSVTLPEGVTSIGNSAFRNCSGLISVTIPESVTSIGSSAFSGCSALTNVTIPEGVTSLGDYSFQNCSGLTGVTLPEHMTSLGIGAFSSCSALTEIQIPTGIEEIGAFTFTACSSLTRVEIPEGVTSISSNAFTACSALSELTLPESLTSIGWRSFSGCSALKKLLIPHGVTKLDECAFINCSNLRWIAFTGPLPDIAGDSFTNVTADAYYPADDDSWWEDDLIDYGGKLTWHGYTGGEIPEPVLTLEPSELSVAVKQTAKLTASGTEAELVWTSSNPEVATVDQNGVVTGIRAGRAIITAKTADGSASASSSVLVQFSDVADASRYFYGPVYWALDGGITTGTSPTTFNPDGNCTREQIVTFLWRLMGQPEPSKITKFTDVPSGSWYENPISWAYEKGITVGLNDGTGRFGVGQACTREMCVTFLWRAAGSPSVATHTDFTDVAAGRYFYDSISWAANGITVGLNDGTGRFGVGQACSRAMIVTFLQRYDSKFN